MKTIINNPRKARLLRMPRPDARPAPSAARRGIAALGLLGVLAVSGCTAAEDRAEGSPGDDGKLQIAASISVYADLAQEIGGDVVEVTPIIDSPAQDPHSYEATPLDALTVQDADLVILNGGGYDGFMEDLLEGSDAPVIDAVEVSGLEPASGDDHDEHSGHDHGHDEDHGHSHGHDGHDHGSFNEHVWYDLPAMERMSAAIAHGIGELAPEHADAVDERGHEYAESLHELHSRLEQLRLDGQFLATEPVADYMLEQAGLEDATPEELTAAVESGLDIPPLLYLEAQEGLESGDVEVLAYNEHTASGQTQRLQRTAEESGAEVVSFTETIPEGMSYLEWMSSNVDELEDIR